jgi:hypothetical protein
MKIIKKLEERIELMEVVVMRGLMGIMMGE